MMTKASIAPVLLVNQDYQLHDSDFQMLKNHIYQNLGINFSERNRVLLQTRLSNRIRTLKLNSFSEYCQFLFSPAGKASEYQYFTDQICTNETSFFRESDHFYYILSEVLPFYYDSLKISKSYHFHIWCAGCSTGEEPYSLAMLFEDYFKNQLKLTGNNFSIVASDISEKALSVAINATYPEIKGNPIPEHLKKQFILRSKNLGDKMIRIAPEIRKQVHFIKHNLLSLFPVKEKFDFIFFRNVLIYFDLPTQQKVIHQMCNNLHEHGILFTGHAESISSLSPRLKYLSPSIYRKV